ncbi:MAG: methylenetetrahydrofolate reductase [NAD(P)H] [Bacteroidales bacterium]
MRVTDLINSSKKTAFSFEVLPPLKGNGLEKVFQTIDTLREFDPKYINITTHRSDVTYKTMENGLYRQVVERKRPGTVAVAAAIQNNYNIPAVPHVICSGFSKSEIEYMLIDLNFLGIKDLLLLRGDKSKNESVFSSITNGHKYAVELQEQVNRFNEGFFLDGTKMDIVGAPFTYGVAGYPEKHEEAPNLDSDMNYLKAKVDAGAEYIVTQMFFDNAKFFEFVNRCREAGINVPIIPGIKPITSMNQLSILPKIFHVDIPEVFVSELRKCKTPEAVKQAGVEWGIQQAKELIANNVPSIHFYTLNATQSVKNIAKEVY